ncbi:MAG: hypothetical protein HQ547_05670 [Candidatus Omnitrophica bacterium]|nr:hypothetical protein [Candidatus Omnitrophota bacterium]
MKNLLEKQTKYGEYGNWMMGDNRRNQEQKERFYLEKFLPLVGIKGG